MIKPLRLWPLSSKSNLTSTSTFFVLLISLACLIAMSFGNNTVGVGVSAFSSSSSSRPSPFSKIVGASTTSSSSSSSSLLAQPPSGSNNNDDEKKKRNNNNDEDDDIFQGIKNFFLNVQTNMNANMSNNINNSNNRDDDDDDELPAGTVLLLKINTKQMKPGGLRLFLMFSLLGMQNTPEPKTWRADQKLMSSPTHLRTSALDAVEDTMEAEKSTYVLEMLYEIDRTGLLQIELIPSQNDDGGEIRLYRLGSRPSTSYLMQESVIVDGILNELQDIAGLPSSSTTTTTGTTTTNVVTTATTITEAGGGTSERQQTEDDDANSNDNNNDNDNDNDTGNDKTATVESPIADEDRLLIPEPLDAIEIARESLAFG